MKKNIIILTAALAASTAVADTSITLTQQGQEASTTVIKVRDGKVAMLEDGVTMGIYDAASGAFTAVDHQNKAYMVMDNASMDAVEDQIASAMKQMEAQLANMPPEQREAMMKMVPGMAERMGGSKKPAGVDVDFTGKSAKVGDYSCKIANVTTAAGVTSEVCIAKPSVLGVDSDDFEAMGAMLDTMQSFAQRFGQDASAPNAKQMGGIPVRMTDEDGETTVLTDVSNAKVDSALFEIPAGYRKRAMTDGM